MASPFDTEEKTYYSKKEMMKIFRISDTTVYNWARAGFIERLQISLRKNFFTLPKIVRSTLKDVNIENQERINNMYIKELLESEYFYSSGELARMYGTIVQRVADWRNFGLIEFVECPKQVFWHRLPTHVSLPKELQESNGADDNVDMNNEE